MAGMPALADVLTRHQVFVQRLAANEVSKFDAFLREMDQELRNRLSADELTDLSRARLAKLLSAVDEMLAGIFSDHSEVVLADLQDFAQHEAGFSARALQAAVNLEVVVPSAAQISAAVLSTPLSIRGPDSGNLLKSFIADWNANDRKAVTGAIRRGVFEGQPNAQIVKAIRGTKALNYTDGLLNVTARHAAAVVHTAVQNVSTAARMRTFQENADIVQGIQWVSTLDNRTCFVAGTPVEMPSGAVPIESLKIGDEVTGGSGKPRRVTDVMRRTSKRLVRVTLSNGKKVICTADHPWLTQRGWVAAGEMTAGEKLPKSL
jgi:hypothetical protein